MIRETGARLADTAIATVGDAEQMPLDSEQFQVVTCNMSIHHYPHPQSALNEMYRILTPGGTLLLNDMDCAAPVRLLANLLFPRLPGGDVKMYTRGEITGMICSAGFERWYYRKISPFTFQCIARKT
ncbi:MAG: methyltransferase domain-containing protein [Oscillospiraceae bacterium]|nr:methyltransferase domain-containing protein [Oscillospiraceae bacterium]